MRMRPLFSAAALVALTATIVGAPATMARGATTRMVDGDGKASVGDCGGGASAPKTIQKAVDASGPGDTILVCPGTYQEQVLIEGADGLTVRGVRPWEATLLTPTELDAPWLLSVAESTGVTIQWLKLAALATEPDPLPSADGAPTCEPLEAGIAVMDSTDVTIRSNKVVAKGAHTLGACGYGVGIAVGSVLLAAAAVAGEAPPFAPVSAKVVNNTVSDFQVIGIVAFGLKTRTDIVQNSVRFRHESDAGDGCGTGTTASSMAPKRANRFREALVDAGVGPSGPGFPIGGDCFAFGILDLLGTSGFVRYNEVWSNGVALLAAAQAAPRPALLGGIVEFGQGPSVAEFGGDLRPQWDAPVVANNRVRGAYAGYALVGADLVRMTDNRSIMTGFGLFVSETRHARVTDNRFAQTFVGIFASDDDFPFFPTDRAEAGNAFRRNMIPASEMLDVSCYDSTAGGGTLGTASDWSGNIAPAGTSSPDGLCDPLD